MLELIMFLAMSPAVNRFLAVSQDEPKTEPPTAVRTAKTYTPCVFPNPCGGGLNLG